MSLARQYVKLCDPRDFADPALIAMARSILPERDPLRHIERKVWEFAMLALFLDEVGRLVESTEALSLGAGDERIVFWLANRVGKVVATDIYGSGAFSQVEAQPSMLEDPRAHAPFPYREDHLEVRWMDARRLDFPDSSFDVVFSLSSIEHFGNKHDVARSAGELGRVLRPGGHAVVITDCLVKHDPLDAAIGAALTVATLGLRARARGNARRTALSQVFTPAELSSRIVRPSGLRQLQPLDSSLSDQAWDQIQPVAPRHWQSEQTPNPFILLKAKRSLLTSVCLAMERPLSP